MLWKCCTRYASKFGKLSSLHFSVSCIGEGNGNPLQCHCLENSMGSQRVGHDWVTFTFTFLLYEVCSSCFLQEESLLGHIYSTKHMTLGKMTSWNVINCRQELGQVTSWYVIKWRQDRCGISVGGWYECPCLLDVDTQTCVSVLLKL